MADWLEQVLAGPPPPRGETWRLHPQRQQQFFGDYLPQHYLERLSRAHEVGWKNAVTDGLDTLPDWIADYTRDYFLARYRSDFVEDLGIQPQSNVLDLGCGWGFASHRALELGANVVGTDNALRRLEFCRARFEQEGLGDRFLGIEMDVNRPFPFREAAFDVVIVSGLLEWVGCSAAGRPEEVQEDFMQRIFATLVPGGRLYLAIENRFWAPYFVGALDMHTRQPLVSILPRRLARAASVLVSGKDYRAYTYSLIGYVGMLRKLGYKKLTALYPKPDYVQPKTVEPLFRDVDLSISPSQILASIRAQHPSMWRSLVGRSFMFVAAK